MNEFNKAVGYKVHIQIQFLFYTLIINYHKEKRERRPSPSLGEGKGQASLVCWGPRGGKESDWVNNKKESKKIILFKIAPKE